jgi:hypothetical protein
MVAMGAKVAKSRGVLTSACCIASFAVSALIFLPVKSLCSRHQYGWLNGRFLLEFGVIPGDRSIRGGRENQTPGITLLVMPNACQLLFFWVNALKNVGFGRRHDRKTNDGGLFAL